jgi:hypothetical protein
MTSTARNATPAQLLGTYEGKEILGTTVSIRNTGSGLEDAMNVQPVKLPLGTTVHVVLECEVEKHRHEPIKDTDGLQLVNMLKAGRATIVDADLVVERLDEQERRIEEAEGTLRLAFDADDSERGGEPSTPGDVLEGAVDLLDDVEDADGARAALTVGLETLTKDELVEQLVAAGLSKSGTRAELVERLVDHELGGS